uniref:Puromycin-sensitive aminopeptidase n=1 Tax=Romanomermis culicivorax TaxID=13658 RepID=A0A915HSW0_ROMCU
MSSYLVAFIVGDFEYVEGYTSDNVRVRIYTLPGKKYQGEFALQVAIKALPFFSNFFGVSYGLPKCDLIAIPDFNFGAMENWGLVTYREVYLLLDPAVSSSFGKEHIALVVAHELAHMWFGNLTTMEWWTDLWLKEGYATWMEYYFVNDAFPEFDIFTQFLTAEAVRAMSLDALKNSHPVEVPINNPNEIEDIYDAVSYSKSASLIRMLHDYLGDKDFRAGLQNYLSKYSFKNTITQNLWDSLTEKSGKNVAGLMSTWTRKMGFPLIKAKTTFEGTKCILHLDQERFLADGSEDDQSTVWHVPITISTSSKSNPIVKYLLTEKSGSLVLDGVSANDSIKLNSGFTGFYKVQYSEHMLEKLITSIKGGHLKPHDRLNLCGDLFSLVRCGKMSTTEFFNLLVVYKNETDYTVWSEIDAAVDVIDNCLQHTDSGESFRRFCCSIYEQEANRLGWEPKPNEGHTVGLLRPLLLKRLGKFGDKKTIEKARLMFRNFVDVGKDMEPDLRSMIFESSDFSEVQRQCLVAIGRSSDVDVQKKCLEYTFGRDKVRLQDSYLVVAGLATTVSGQDTIWQYFKTNMRQLIKKFGSPNSALFGHVIKVIQKRIVMIYEFLAEIVLQMVTSYHCSEEKAKEIEEFFKENEDVMTAANRPIKQSLETIYLNSDLLRRDKDAIGAWLAKN